METVIPYYYSHSKCGNVRIIIAPFGYGPRVAAETMAKLLNLTIGEWHINSTPIKNERFEVTYNFGVAQPINEPETSYRIWVDCLMWLRNKIPKEVADYDLFLAENFFTINPLLIKQMNNSNIKDIAPLYSLNGHSTFIKTNKSVATDGHILVSFGGVETPFTTDIHRFVIPKLVLESLAFASNKLNDKRKIVCCLPSHILEQFQHNPKFSEVNFLSPAHEEFLQILNNASLYVVQPGLYGPFEAFENGIPTVFTTPFSYTQVCQAKAYDKEGLSGYIPMWKQLDNEIGVLFGDIENEEEYCFDKISIWIQDIIKENNSKYYCEWAMDVLKGAVISEQETMKRMNYIKKRRDSLNNQLQEIIFQYEKPNSY
jgi:hypothetical protein